MASPLATYDNADRPSKRDYATAKEHEILSSDEDERVQKRRKLDHTADFTLSAAPAPTLKVTQSLFTPTMVTNDATSLRYVYTLAPPTVEELQGTTEFHDIPSKIYQAPYYSVESDAPARPREYAGLLFDLKGGTGISNLEEWVAVEEHCLDFSGRRNTSDVYGWEYAGSPPSLREARKWLRDNEVMREEQRRKSSQVMSQARHDTLMCMAHTSNPCLDCWSHSGERHQDESSRAGCHHSRKGKYDFNVSRSIRYV